MIFSTAVTIYSINPESPLRAVVELASRPDGIRTVELRTASEAPAGVLTGSSTDLGSCPTDVRLIFDGIMRDQLPLFVHAQECGQQQAFLLVSGPHSTIVDWNAVDRPRRPCPVPGSVREGPADPRDSICTAARTRATALEEQLVSHCGSVRHYTALGHVATVAMAGLIMLFGLFAIFATAASGNPFLLIGLLALAAITLAMVFYWGAQAERYDEQRLFYQQQLDAVRAELIDLSEQIRLNCCRDIPLPRTQC